MIAVITTGTRPYLAQTLAHASEGTEGARRVVLVDGDARLPRAPAGWDVIRFAEGHPARQNKWVGFRAIELAAELGEDLLFLEDDLELAAGAAGVMHGLGVPLDVAFVSFFVPWPGPAFPAGLWRGHPNAYAMAQALKLSLVSCVQLAAYRRSPRWTAIPNGGVDELIRFAAIDLGWRFAFYAPGLVRHVGAESAVGNGPLSGPRICRNYVGRDCDVAALKWPREWFS